MPSGAETLVGAAMLLTAQTTPAVLLPPGTVVLQPGTYLDTPWAGNTPPAAPWATQPPAVVTTPGGTFYVTPPSPGPFDKVGSPDWRDPMGQYRR